jgi:hypothetical protein
MLKLYRFELQTSAEEEEEEEESGWFQPPLGQNGVARPPHFWPRGWLTAGLEVVRPPPKGQKKKKNPQKGKHEHTQLLQET